MLEKMTDLRYVIFTDSKDVVFQADPTIWLNEHMGDKDIVVGSEGSRYAQAADGNDRVMREAFGSGALGSMRGQEVLNMGVLVGRPPVLKQLLERVLYLSLQDQRRSKCMPTHADCICDQQALNLLLRDKDFENKVLITHAEDGFSFGAFYQSQSYFREGAIYSAATQAPYSIFHQYFEKPEWWRAVRNKYHV
jgi:hypothetical protein